MHRVLQVSSQDRKAPELEPCSLQLEVISEQHKAIAMRIDFHVTFNLSDKGETLRQKLGMAESSFSRLRRGTKEITLTDLQILAKFFNTTVINILKINF